MAPIKNTFNLPRLDPIVGQAEVQNPAGLATKQTTGKTGGLTNAALSRGIGALAGLGSIAQMGISMAQIQDSSPYQMQIDQFGQIGDSGASSYNQLADMYAENARGVVAPTADELRGMDTGQKLGSVLSSTMTGASAGSAFGVPGAIVGGIAGLGAGVAGWLVGDARAKSEADRLIQEREKAQERNRLRLGVAGNRIAENNFRSQYANIGAEGGQIQRQTLQEFAERTLKKNRMPASYGQRPFAYKRVMCNGGVKIAIRTK